ncbi:hypothetical protein BJ170DRAFT_605997 [Xylariales sp. AK1849]|nr:hypothetical protein BJ170DRAFT_605997 [Xylariales sp. AK1849]
MDGNECKVFSFLELPYHVRHEIYTFVLDYPDLDPVFARIESQSSEDDEEHEKTRLPKCVLPTPHVPARLKTTPGILLCNRQTAWEAREAMYFKTFTLKRPPPYTKTLGKPMDITEFISEDTLKGVRRVELVMNLYGNPRAWAKTVETLLDVWSIENHLRKIDITLEQPKEMPPGHFWIERFARYAIQPLSMIQSFAKEAGIQLTGIPLSELCVKKENADL